MNEQDKELRKYWIKTPKVKEFDFWETEITDQEYAHTTEQDFKNAICLIDFRDYKDLEAKLDSYIKMRDELLDMIKLKDAKLVEADIACSTASESNNVFIDQIRGLQEKLAIATEALEYIEQNLESPKKIELKIDEALEKMRN